MDGDEGGRVVSRTREGRKKKKICHFCLGWTLKENETTQKWFFCDPGGRSYKTGGRYFLRF